MQELSVDQKLRKMTESIMHYTHDLSSKEIDDLGAREAFRVLRNCLDVIVGLSIPEIEDELKRCSKRLGKIHLIHNNLTPAQRSLLEGWVFDDHE